MENISRWEGCEDGGPQRVAGGGAKWRGCRGNRTGGRFLGAASTDSHPRQPPLLGGSLESWPQGLRRVRVPGAGCRAPASACAAASSTATQRQKQPSARRQWDGSTKCGLDTQWRVSPPKGGKFGTQMILKDIVASHKMQDSILMRYLEWPGSWRQKVVEWWSSGSGEGGSGLCVVG